jgi:hypothetical protein
MVHAIFKVVPQRLPGVTEKKYQITLMQVDDNMPVHYVWNVAW